MSRGLGHMQRAALWWLEHSLPALLARAVEGDGRWFAVADIGRDLDYVQREALRRSVTTLAARGLVEIERRPHGWYCRLPVRVGKQPTLSPKESGQLVEDVGRILGGRL